MHTINFEETLEAIIAKDPRYPRGAYLFLREALDHTQRIVVKGNQGEPRHVTGRELLAGIREFALREFGPMTITVLAEWGISQCSDFGELVFNLVDHNLLNKTEKDSREDFKEGYDFYEAFRKPFLPAKVVAAGTTPPDALLKRG